MHPLGVPRPAHHQQMFAVGLSLTGFFITTRAELHEMLESTLLESSNAGMSKDQIAALIDAIFIEADTDGDGEISFQE